MHYHFEALGKSADHLAIARGINAKGIVVGWTSKSPQPPQACIWMPGQPQAPIILPFTNVQGTFQTLNKVNDFGNAAGVYEFVVSGTTQLADLTTLLGNNQFVVTDINNSDFISGYALGKGFIYNYQNHVYTQIPSSPFPGPEATCPFGINATGTAVGCSACITPSFDIKFIGFIHSGGMRRDLGNCVPYDVNDQDLAVGLLPGDDTSFADFAFGFFPFGFPPSSSPMWIDCSQAAPTPKLIPLPAGFLAGVATAINNKGMVVGFCWGAPGGNYAAFVYKLGSTAADLNTLLVPPLPNWHLGAAWDINDSGQIVGTAAGHNGKAPFETNGFILTPKN
jgi:probable HAF family extracellular repeat protein